MPISSNLDTVGSSDKITITSLTANALNVGILDGADFTFTKGAGFAEGTYVLFDANSAIAGSIGSAAVDLGPGYAGTLSIDSATNNVLLTVVPEPSTYMLMGLGLTLVLWRKTSDAGLGFNVGGSDPAMRIARTGEKKRAAAVLDECCGSTVSGSSPSAPRESQTLCRKVETMGFSRCSFRLACLRAESSVRKILTPATARWDTGLTPWSGLNNL